MTPDRPAIRTLLVVLGAGQVANGLVMLGAAAPWFERIARETGPFNGHLVRDVGAAYAAAGVALLFAAFAPRGPRPPRRRGRGLPRAPRPRPTSLELGVGARPRQRAPRGSSGVHLPALVVLVLAAAFLRRPAEVS